MRTSLGRRSAITSAAVAALAVAAPAFASSGPDAALIVTCRRFAEAQFAEWYRYVVAPDHMVSELEKAAPDWETYDWIVATLATTPEGWRSKALAYAAWDRSALDDPEDERDSTTAFLSSLMRDIVTPERDAIIAKLAQQYGPLPKSYSVNGLWLGSDG